MLPSFRLAQKLHTQLVKETMELQRHVVLQQLVTKEFGADALPVRDFHANYQNTLTKAAENSVDDITRQKERIAENIETLRELEKMFAEKHEADMDDLAKYFAERFREDRRRETAKKKTAKVS